MALSKYRAQLAIFRHINHVTGLVVLMFVEFVLSCNCIYKNSCYTKGKELKDLVNLFNLAEVIFQWFYGTVCLESITHRQITSKSDVANDKQLGLSLFFQNLHSRSNLFVGNLKIPHAHNINKCLQQLWTSLDPQWCTALAVCNQTYLPAVTL